MRSDKRRLDVKDAAVEDSPSKEENKTSASSSSGPKLFTNSKASKQTMAAVQDKDKID